MENAKHTPGPWAYDGGSRVDAVAYRTPSGHISKDGSEYIGGLVAIPYSCGEGSSEANANPIAAAPDFSALANNFEVTGPDDDGFVWLVLHGNGTSGKAMFNLGAADQIAVQVALHLEADRRAAIAKATGSTPC